MLPQCTFFAFKLTTTTFSTWKRYACSTRGTPKEELALKDQELSMPHYCADGSWNTSLYPLYKKLMRDPNRNTKRCVTQRGRLNTPPRHVCSSQGKTVNKKSRIFNTECRQVSGASSKRTNWEKISVMLTNSEQKPQQWWGLVPVIPLQPKSDHGWSTHRDSRGLI